MLLELQIQDFALIEKLRLEFTSGLNILTGETGAGKSIIIDSVNFVLGERASKDIIRTGVEKTFVEAVFEKCSNPEFLKVLDSYGLECDDDIVILTRELYQSGRGICRVNGRVVTTSILKNIANYLIDIHGQHEHQSLLNEEGHIDMLDSFGGSKVGALREEVQCIYGNALHIKRQLSSLFGDDRERERRIDLLNFQIEEIEGAKLRIGEEEDLLKQRALLNNSEKLFSTLSDSYVKLYESEEGQSVFDKLGHVISEFEGIKGLDEKLDYIKKCVEDSYYLLEGAITDIREYRDRVDFDPGLIDEVEQRLDTINKLKRKYGSSVRAILDYYETIQGELKDILNSQEKIEELKKELQREYGKLFEKSKALSDLRLNAAEKLQKRIVDELKFLGMEKTRFIVSVTTLKKDGQVTYNTKGMDLVKFLISTNPGEPEKPLSKVASGGELSRIMLAIKTVLANSDKIPSLIFDEIDTGISGKAAQAVGEKLGEISKTHQVICVTHLPQIASMADAHFYISKKVVSGRTITNVKKLDREEQIKEIARMVGGAKLTELTLKHAEEMLFMAQNTKNDNNRKKQ